MFFVAIYSLQFECSEWGGVRIVMKNSSGIFHTRVFRFGRVLHIFWPDLHSRNTFRQFLSCFLHGSLFSVQNHLESCLHTLRTRCSPMHRSCIAMHRHDRNCMAVHGMAWEHLQTSQASKFLEQPMAYWWFFSTCREPTFFRRRE